MFGLTRVWSSRSISLVLVLCRRLLQDPVLPVPSTLVNLRGRDGRPARCPARSIASSAAALPSTPGYRCQTAWSDSTIQHPARADRRQGCHGACGAPASRLRRRCAGPSPAKLRRFTRSRCLVTVGFAIGVRVRDHIERTIDGRARRKAAAPMSRRLRSGTLKCPTTAIASVSTACRRHASNGGVKMSRRIRARSCKNGWKGNG